MKTKTNETKTNTHAGSNARRPSGSIGLFYQDRNGGGPYYSRSYEHAIEKETIDSGIELWYRDFVSE